VICENDEFEYDRGEIVIHKIDFRKPRGEAYAAYVILRLRDGGTKTEVIPKDEIYAIRDKSQGWKAFKGGKVFSSVWDPREPGIEREMWKKTAFRRATKWVPLSAEIRDVLQREDEDEVRQEPEQKTILLSGGQSKSDVLAELLSQRSESIEIQQDAQQRREEIEDQEPERQKPQSTLNEIEMMMASAGIKSIECDPATNTQKYQMPDGMLLKIGNGLDETKSKTGLAILDAMKAETPQIVRKMIELAKAVKK
jgi:recombinational DNA repair protein RecT